MQGQGRPASPAWRSSLSASKESESRQAAVPALERRVDGCITSPLLLSAEASAESSPVPTSSASCCAVCGPLQQDCADPEKAKIAVHVQDGRHALPSTCP